VVKPTLASIEPFRSLPDAQRKRLADASHEASFLKGQTIVRTGTGCNEVWLVQRGRVHMKRITPDGKSLIACVAGPGELFCCLPALDRKSYPIDAVAATDTTVLCIPAGAFHDAMARAPAFARQTVCLFCERLREMEHSCCMIYESAERRLAQVLLGLVRKFGPTIPMTRLELAEMAGIAQETAIRTLARLSRRGIIRSVRGKTTVLAADALESLLHKA